MNNTELITYISIAVIAISLFSIGTQMTGNVTRNDTAIVNVTIDTSAAINFTTDFLDFGSGAVTPGFTAVIYSDNSTEPAYWTGSSIDAGLILENIGNTNVTLQLQADKDATSFIGGTSPGFQAKVSDVESGSCTGTNTFSTFADMTTSPQDACATAFAYDTDIDTLRVDFKLSIPDNAIGSKTVEIKAIGTY